MKFPLTNQPAYKVQHYLGKTVGEMLRDPTAQVFLSGLSASQLVLTAPNASVPSTPSIAFNDSAGTFANVMTYRNGADFSYIVTGPTIPPAMTGRNMFAIGRDALLNATTARDTIAIGALAGWSITTAEKNTIIGSDALDTGNIGDVGPYNVAIGANIYDAGTGIGDHNVILGAFNGATGVTEPLGQFNIIIGTGNFVGNPTPLNNSTIIGNSIATRLPNVIILGASTQNTIIGAPRVFGATDNGNRLQIYGTLNTGGAAPLTAGAGAWDFGKIKTATSTLNTTKYLEVAVDGVLYKVCVN